MAEWLKAHAWKVCDAREGVPGFESLLLRFFLRKKLGIAEGNARVLFLKTRVRVKLLPGFFVTIHEKQGNLAAARFPCQLLDLGKIALPIRKHGAWGSPCFARLLPC